jgi:hypothetical protein
MWPLVVKARADCRYRFIETTVAQEHKARPARPAKGARDPVLWKDSAHARAVEGHLRDVLVGDVPFLSGRHAISLEVHDEHFVIGNRQAINPSIDSYSWPYLGKVGRDRNFASAGWPKCAFEGGIAKNTKRLGCQGGDLGFSDPVI